MTEQRHDTRDRTQYAFGGRTMGKARLVLALVQRYAGEHPRVTFERLREAFPDNLQADSPLQFSGMRCVVARLDRVPAGSTRRFYTADDERIVLCDAVAVVWREWNLHNIQNVLAHAERLGYEVAVARRA